MDPVLALLNSYGLPAVVVYILLKDVGGYLLARLFPGAKPPAPPPPLPPGVPSVAPVPGSHPLLAFLLGKLFAAQKVPAPADPAHAPAAVLEQLRDEVLHALSRQAGLAPLPPLAALPAAVGWPTGAQILPGAGASPPPAA